jgi:hypothetical protein
MPFQTSCVCGAVHTFDDHFDGQLTKCATCRSTFVARVRRTTGDQDASSAKRPTDPFDRDRFLLKQKILTVHETYEIADEDGQVILSAHRPARWPERIKANIIAGFMFCVVFFAFMFLGEYLHDGRNRSNTLYAVVIMIGGVMGCLTAVCFQVYYTPLRATYIYLGSGQAQKVLDIPQLTRFAVFSVTYCVRDLNRNVLAVIERNYLRDLFRGYWVVRSPDRLRVICIIEEDAVLLAILRRLLVGWLRYVDVPWVGPWTNFVIRSGAGEVLGTFNRKLTLFDRYPLDLSDDPKRMLDRRVAVAIGVLLDTGEGR